MLPEVNTTTGSIGQELVVKDRLETIVQAPPTTSANSAAKDKFCIGGVVENASTSERYRITQRRGRGAFAAVYQAVHIETGDVVAIKALHNKFSIHDDERSRFLSEIAMLRSLSGSKYSPEIRDHGNVGNTPIYVMELFDLMLSDLVHNTNVAKKALIMLCDCCAYLSTVEVVDAAGVKRRGIVHGDIAPGNIGVVSTHFKLTDFGSAMYGDELPRKINEIISTPPFGPPEYVVEGIVTDRLDTYSAVMTFLEMLTPVTLEENSSYTSAVEFVEDTRQKFFDRKFKKILNNAGSHYSQRPTPVNFREMVSEHFNTGGRIFRENAAHSRSPYSLLLQ
jgi:serine/threonine protein kinase